MYNRGMKEPSVASPPAWRIVAAFLFAPLFAALAIGWMQPMFFGMPSITERVLRSTFFYATFGAYPPAIALGVPIFLILRKRTRTSIGNCAAFGAIIAVTPWVLLDLMLENAGSSSMGGHATTIDGVRTIWGWLYFLRFLLDVAAFGALGGLAFWVIAAAGIGRSARAPE
ncbi:hypothetical protein [Methylobrevis albus]|uniref:Uncharacterized protein n=1 Tax=Methylobrevis albus TaxID=2793297 RepID=A0A931I583_9HYPH|nr:hypothetical protein [Methylobrevis albus]MBH0239804.1 hypothetical protein [Methylobrevis albus]